MLCKVGSHHLRVGANRRDDVCTELRASATTVLNLLVSSTVIYICYIQYVLQVKITVSYPFVVEFCFDLLLLQENDQNFSFFKEIREQKVIHICTIFPTGERNEINAYGAC